jgi:hypothetical protein
VTRPNPHMEISREAIGFTDNGGEPIFVPIGGPSGFRRPAGR